MSALERSLDELIAEEPKVCLSRDCDAMGFYS